MQLPSWCSSNGLWMYDALLTSPFKSQFQIPLSIIWHPTNTSITRISEHVDSTETSPSITRTSHVCTCGVNEGLEIYSWITENWSVISSAYNKTQNHRVWMLERSISLNTDRTDDMWRLSWTNIGHLLKAEAASLSSLTECPKNVCVHTD